MTIDHGLLGRLRSRGEEVLTQVSAELMSNPRFLKAMEGAMPWTRSRCTVGHRRSVAPALPWTSKALTRGGRGRRR